MLLNVPDRSTCLRANRGGDLRPRVDANERRVKTRRRTNMARVYFVSARGNPRVDDARIRRAVKKTPRTVKSGRIERFPAFGKSLETRVRSGSVKPTSSIFAFTNRDSPRIVDTRLSNDGAFSLRTYADN